MGLIIRSSQIHAAGCYTTAPIRKGTTVIEYTGRRISKVEGDRLYQDRDCTYLFGIGDGKTVIDGHGMAAFINHSCDPNCETQEDDDGRVWIVATRNIAEGEELTYDYMLYDGEGEAPCFCGARKCRGTMYSKEEVRKRKRAAGRRKKPAGVRRRKTPPATKTA
jgi:SET domain-containing protein